MAWQIHTTDGFVDVTDDCVARRLGFVYLITHVASGRAYVGKKLLVSRRTKPPLKGHKRKRRSVVESDWRDYWGSSNELLADVERYGEAAFTRQILHLCDSRGMLSYMEMKEQLARDVLLDPEGYYNAFVGGKIHRSHLLQKTTPQK